MKLFTAIANKKILLRSILLISLLFCSAQFAKAFENGHHGILYVDDIWQGNKISHISKPIYFGGVEKCKEPFNKFWGRAKEAFADYLKSNYPKIYDDPGVDLIIHKKNGNTLLETYEDALRRTNQLKDDLESEGFKSVTVTTFTFENQCG